MYRSGFSVILVVLVNELKWFNAIGFLKLFYFNLLVKGYKLLSLERPKNS